MSKPVSPEHALYIGAVFGLATRRGLPVLLFMDEDGDLTDTLIVMLDGEAGPAVTLNIPPPPDDWSIDDWMPE